jgi:hypothetical protein
MKTSGSRRTQAKPTLAMAAGRLTAAAQADHIVVDVYNCAAQQPRLF